MSTRIDDRLFVGLLSGDDKAVAQAWLAVFQAAHALARGYFGGEERSMLGQSAEDIASNATCTFVTAVMSGSITDDNVFGYLAKVVRSKFVDVWRRSNRHTELVVRVDDAGVAREPDVADLAPTPECALATAEVRREVIREWCLWPQRLEPSCAVRPALVELLTHMRGYIRMELCQGQPVAPHDRSTLLDLVDTADVGEVHLSLEELNAYIMARRITRVALDQRWKYLRKIADVHGISDPPGLRRSYAKRSGIGRSAGVADTRRARPPADSKRETAHPIGPVSAADSPLRLGTHASWESADAARARSARRAASARRNATGLVIGPE